MLTILDRKQRYCDGISRRAFLKIGGLALGSMGGVGLSDVFRAEAKTGTSSSHKAVINIFLGGGPPHQDMWDVKMDAPAEIRGEFKAIPTSVPGIEICEVFPKIASMMQKFVAIRSVVGSEGHHDSYQCMSGWDHRSLSALGGRPCIGSILTKLKGPADPSVPPFVGLAPKTAHAPWGSPGIPGFLGPAYQSFTPDGPGMANLTLNGISFADLDDRKRLLQSMDGLRRDLDAQGMMSGMDAYTERALGVLTSSKLLAALDISKEHPRVRDLYGDGKPYEYTYDGAPTANDLLLRARRLVEAGARCVSLTYGRWDSHGDNFKLMRDYGRKLDQAVTALVTDLEARDMLDDVSVIVWGEFGRTPRVNAQAGRDHWPQVSCALMAGGGMRTGQVIGSTNRLGEYAKDRPVHFQEIFSTLYHNLGIDTNNTTLEDPTGRPQFLTDIRQPIRELV